MAINGGSVRYLKRVQVAQFEPAEAEVTISFAGESDAETIKNLETAGLLAFSKANELLGLKTDVKVVPVAGTGEQPATAPKASKPPKAAKAAPSVAVVVEDEEVTVSTTGTSGSAAVVEDDEPLVLTKEQVVTKPTTTAVVEDDDDLLTGSVQEISDKDFTHAITSHNATVKNTAAIKALISEFIAPPGHAHEIPQARRQEFLDKLKKIGPKA